MRLHHQQLLEAPMERVWNNFNDLYRVGRCFPGAKVTTVTGDAFEGVITSTLGPLVLTFDGAGSVTTRDEERHRIAITADGHQRRGPGKAHIVVQVQLFHRGPQHTLAQMVTELQLRALPSQLGAGLAQRASDPLIERFLLGMGSPTPCPDDDGPDETLDIGRDIVSGLVKSYRRSAESLLRRR